MDDHRGKWRLLETTDSEGVATLEYLGRLSRKRTPPVNFLERLRTAHAGVHDVTFRSLRKMIDNTAELTDAPAAPDGKDGKAAPDAERSTH